MSFVDIDEDGNDELIVGSNDYYIRGYKGEELTHELKENSEIKLITRINKTSFAYTLANNTVGIYRGKTRVWKIKHKQTLTSHVGIDLNEKNNMLVLSFANGRLEVRNCSDGVLLWKKVISEKIICMHYLNIKGDTQNNITCYTSLGGSNYSY